MSKLPPYKNFEGSKKLYNDLKVKQKAGTLSKAEQELFNRVSTVLNMLKKSQEQIGWQKEYWTIYEQHREWLKSSKGTIEESAAVQAHEFALGEVAKAHNLKPRAIREGIVHARGYHTKHLERDWHPSDDEEPSQH